MNPILKTGIAIGLGCVAWTFVMGFTGWYKDPAMVKAFFLVIGIEIVLLVWGLRQTAAANGYGAQVLAGTAMAGVAAAIIFCGSLVFTTVVFPSYFQELEAMGRGRLQAQGLKEEEISQALATQAKVQTPFFQALFGAIGTVITGLVASLVIAVFSRRK